MIRTTIKPDFLVVGSGVAGLNAAWKASQYGQVALLTKSTLKTSSSYWAQGGIAAVLRDDDSFANHKKDTLIAGRGLCDKNAVDVLVREGARCVKELIDLGMPFDRKGGKLEMGLEGGHSHRRVLHANGAATGKALVEFLIQQVQRQPNIVIFENAFVFELITDQEICRGANAYQYKKKELINVQSPVTILATGGYSDLYQRSTNPHTSTGDGLWLGYNAGTELEDLEFVQFHPTAFYSDDGSTFLISEAVRGEGAYLINEDGNRFMDGYPQKELSPRDVVSKEIFKQIQKTDSSHVYLDVRHLDCNKLRTQFPNLISKIEACEIDIEEEAIPVAPAAHYCIGGIATDLDGRTSVEGLYACGEVAATKVHGANRLASNSLLECLVFSKRSVNHAKNYRNDLSIREDDAIANFKIDDSGQSSFLNVRQKVAEILTTHVGIERNESGLTKALNELSSILSSSDREYYKLRTHSMLKIAKAITNSALQRRESRGVHLRTDFPDTDKKLVARRDTEQKPILTDG